MRLPHPPTDRVPTGSAAEVNLAAHTDFGYLRGLIGTVVLMRSDPLTRHDLRSGTLHLDAHPRNRMSDHDVDLDR